MNPTPDNPYMFTEPDDALWQQYDQLATRCFGHPVADISALRRHATARVATRGGRVVAGGLGLGVGQFFGGKAVPSGCLGAGCVAPEERGHQLADLLLTEWLRALREHGALLATLWTSSNAYLRRLGWQAPVPVLGWTVGTDDLRAFTPAPTRPNSGSPRTSKRCNAAPPRTGTGPSCGPTGGGPGRLTRAG
jgi:GNAT superfamily N-acetyltransferase